LFFGGARYGGGQLVTNLPSRAAEKQKKKAAWVSRSINR